MSRYIVFDTETSGLGSGLFLPRKNGKLNITTSAQAVYHHGDVATRQIAYHDSKTDKIKHFNIDVDHEEISKFFIKGSEHKRNVGPFKNLSAYRVQHIKDKEEVYSYIFNNENSKLNGAKARAYYDTNADRLLRESQETLLMLNLKTFKSKSTSLAVLKMMIDSGEVLSPELFDQAVSNFADRGIDVKRISQAQYAGKGEDSLHGMVKDWLKGASQKNKTIIAAWNPNFDVTQIISDLNRFGHHKLAERLWKKWDNGSIVIDDMEQAWQKISWQVSQENPALASKFRIGTHLEAAVMTGRPGAIAKTYEEHRYAAKWTAEHVSNALHALTGVKVDQTHAAGPDVYNEIKSMAPTLNEINTGFDAWSAKIKEERGIEGQFIEFMTEKYGKEKYGAFRKVIEDAADASNKYRKPSGIWSKGSTKKAESLLRRWGGTGAFIGLGLAFTYLGAGEDKLNPFGSVKGFKNYDPKTKPFNRYTEDNNPIKVTQALPLAGWMAATGGILWRIGKTERGKLKKFGPKFIPTAPKDYVKEAVKNMYYGVKKTEAHLAITRVFNLSSTLDHFMENRRWKGNKKAFIFNNIVDGKIVPQHRSFKNPGHGILFDEILDVTKEHISVDAYNKVDAIFNPTTVNKGVAKRRVGIRQLHDETVIFAEEFDKAGVKIGEKLEARLPMSINIHRYRSGEQTNRLSYQTGQSYYAKSGKVPYIGWGEYLARRDVPDFIKKNPEYAKAWKGFEFLKYKLELVPKGVGQARNDIFPGMAHALSQTNFGIKVTSVKGNLFTNVKLAYRYGALAVKGLFSDRMNTFFESPFEIPFIGSNKLDVWANKLKGSKNVLSKIAGSGVSFVNRPHLGLPYYSMKGGFFEYMAKVGLKRILPAYLAYQAFDITDHALGKLTFSPTGKGPLTTVPTNIIKAGALAYSKISDITGFTSYAKRQEKYAPGSTGLGIFAPAMSMLTGYKAAQLLYKHGPHAIRENIDKVGQRLLRNSTIANALKPEAYKGALGKSQLERVIGWAAKNPGKGIFAMMMVPMLPFLPGFLGSNKTYKERKAEYDGKKDIAVRQYRGWMLSSSALAGGKPIQFRRHFMNLVQSDYQNRGVIWPSFGSKMVHQLSFGLLNRYKLEEYHAESQPVYESAGYGVNVPFLGSIIADTVGRIVKPVRQYHELPQSTGQLTGEDGHLSPVGLMIDTPATDSQDLGKALGTTSQNSMEALNYRFNRQLHDLVGFTGFAYESARMAVLGSKAKENVPFYQGANEMYNPAQEMWGWHLGDITGVAGEMLRRIFPYPGKDWTINEIPNELNGVSWIPQVEHYQDPYKNKRKDITHGTTFDKFPMGWLTASRKGWEFLYGTQGLELEEYPDVIRAKILQNVSPFSREMKEATETGLYQARTNLLTPEREQEFYETINQARQLKDKIYTHDDEFAYRLQTVDLTGTVDKVFQDGGFTLDGDDRKYKLAGVSLDDADIRSSLLKKNEYNTAEEVEKDLQNIKSRTDKMINSHIRAGQKISLSIPDVNQNAEVDHGVEAMIGDLNRSLIDQGAAFKNTGHLASHNMQQDAGGLVSRMTAKYWGALTSRDTFWNKKLVAQRATLNNYLQNQVFNREVKMWYRPIDHFIKPLFASTLHRLGVNIIPAFTKERRADQEYWDIVKYIKYKSLAVHAAKSGNEEEAAFYHKMWRATMIGSDPTDGNFRDELKALPANERLYFDAFSNESDPKKRSKIMKYLPEASKRIYNAIWTKREALSSRDPDKMAEYENLVESDGWGISDKERDMYQQETGGNVTKGDWIRAKVVNEYIKHHDMPGADWQGWAPELNIENVEILTLEAQNKQYQDYGYFDDKARVAAFDRSAHAASMELMSAGSTSSETSDLLTSYIIQDDSIENVMTLPTQSTSPIASYNMNTGGHERMVKSNNDKYGSLLQEGYQW